MTPETPAALTPPKRQVSRLWRWLRRCLWTALGLFLILIVFHRPILRLALRHAAPWIAESGGMKVVWDVDGTIVSGIDLTGISVTGNAEAPLQQLTADRIRADYSLWRLITDGPGQFVDDVHLRNVNLVLDTTKFPKPDPKRPKTAPPPPPKIVLPRLRLENVSARIILPEGTVAVTGLNFTIERDRNGVLEFTDLQLPGNLPALHQVSGTTTATGSSLTFSALKLLPDLLVRNMAIDFSRLPERQLSVEGSLTVPGGKPADAVAAGGGGRRVTEGTGDVQFKATLGNLGREPSLSATATLTGLTPDTFRPLAPMPPGIEWNVTELTAAFDGPVNSPQAITADISLKAGNVRAGNVRLDRAVITASLKGGRLQVASKEIAAGSNRLVATASAQFPAAWKDMGGLNIDFTAGIDFPEVAEWFTTGAPVSGRLTGKVAASLKSGKLDTAQADLEGSQWKTQGIPIDSISVAATTDGRALKVSRLKAQFDPENTIEAQGSLGLDSTQTLTASWQVDIPNMERLSRWTGSRAAAGPDAGWLKGTGEVSGNLSDWQRQDFSRTTAGIRMEGSGVAWKTGRMESLALEAAVADGRAELRRFVAVLNDRNRITASGSAETRAPWAFTAKVNGDLTQLPDFKGWLEALGAPAPLSGKAAIQWEGSGRLDAFQLTGGGAVKIESLKMPGMKESAALSLKSSHSGQRAEISTLEAALGDLRVSAPCTITNHLLSIPAIKVTAGHLPPVEGRIRVPLDFTQKDGPAGPVATSGNIGLSLTVRGLDFTEAGKAAGTRLPVTGKMDADVTLTGSILNPAAAVTVKLQNVTSPDAKRKLSPADGTITLNLKDRKLESIVEVMQKPLQTLRATGSMPLDVDRILRNPQLLRDAPLEASVTLPDSDLNALRSFLPDVSSMKGSVGLSAKVSGSLRSPRITGELHATSPAVAFRKPDVPDARNVRVKLKFDGTRVFIEEAGAMLAGGTASARGSVDWTETANPRIDVTLTAQEALVLRDDSISMRADGTVTCRGSLKQAAVTGRIELVRGRVFKEIEFLPLSLPNQLPPAPPSVTVGSNAPPALPPPFDNWTFNVDIVTRDPVRLLGNVLNGGVVSDLHLRGTGGRPVLEGKVSLKDARVRLPFSRMTISRGDVVFTKERPFQPQLDVQGDSFVNNYQVTLNAYGSALDPKIRFSSSPPLPEGEIATLLATGSTSGDLRTSEGEAANRAAFLLISQMYRKMFRKGALATESESPPRLSFNFSLLNSSSGTGRSFSAIYEINKHLQAVGSMSQRGSFRGLLYYLIRFR